CAADSTGHVVSLRCASALVCFGSSAEHRDRHSFPTRRSSDLGGSDDGGGGGEVGGAGGSGGTSSPPDFRRFSPRTAIEGELRRADRKSTRLNSSHVKISYAVFCLKKKKQQDKFKGANAYELNS